MTRRTAAALLSAALGAGALAGCSSGSETARPTTTRHPTSGPTSTPASTSAITSTTTAPPGPATSTVEPSAPPAPSTPAEAAASVTAAEDAIATPSTTGEALASAAKRQQVAYRAVAAHPEWDAAVRDAVPARWHANLEANVTAGRELRALTKPRDALPPWHIVAPAPAAELLAYYREAERAFGVPWAYLAAIHLVETRMGRIRGDSTAGAKGPMQFMPATWAAYGGGGDIESNRDAIFAAARYLKANGAPGDMANALWNYNHSDRYVRAVTLYAQRMLAEARSFDAYWHWDVYYRLTAGDVLLPVGWHRD